MTTRKTDNERVKGSPIMSWLKNIQHHKFRKRTLCTSSRYNDIMAEAKAEFDALELRNKQLTQLNKKTRFSAQTGIPCKPKVRRVQTAASA